MRRFVGVVVAACSSPAAPPAPVDDPAPVRYAVEPDPFRWPGWGDCTPPSADEFVVLERGRGLVAVDAVSLEPRTVLAAPIEAAVTDPHHQRVWFSVSGGDQAGLWTLDLSRPCDPPVAMIAGIEPGDFSVSFGDGGLTLETNCASVQLAWTLDDRERIRPPITAASPGSSRINESLAQHIASAGPGRPHRRLTTGVTRLGATGVSIALGPVTGAGYPCALRDTSGRDRPFGSYRMCVDTIDIHLDPAGRRWLYDGDVCTATSCRQWRADPDEVSYIVGWFRPGEILAFERSGAGC